MQRLCGCTQLCTSPFSTSELVHLIPNQPGLSTLGERSTRTFKLRGLIFRSVAVNDTTLPNPTDPTGLRVFVPANTV